MQKIEDHMDKLVRGEIAPVLTINTQLKEISSVAESKNISVRMNQIEEL